MEGERPKWRLLGMWRMPQRQRSFHLEFRAHSFSKEGIQDPGLGLFGSAACCLYLGVSLFPSQVGGFLEACELGLALKSTAAWVLGLAWGSWAQRPLLDQTSRIGRAAQVPGTWT